MVLKVKGPNKRSPGLRARARAPRARQRHLILSTARAQPRTSLVRTPFTQRTPFKGNLVSTRRRPPDQTGNSSTIKTLFCCPIRTLSPGAASCRPGRPEGKRDADKPPRQAMICGKLILNVSTRDTSMGGPKKCFLYYKLESLGPFYFETSTFSRQ